ncbi:MAG TPA: flavodoxin family protein [Verrucomicrobia bacterium]|nr:flavodoxin family protein [Verrucomicrobiota bacterium]
MGRLDVLSNRIRGWARPLGNAPGKEFTHMENQHLTRRSFIRGAGVAAAMGMGTIVSSRIYAQDDGTAKRKIVAVNCSPRRGQTTFRSLQECLAGAAAVSDRIETTLVELGGLAINGNLAAGIPLAEGEKDDFPSVAGVLSAPDVIGIVIGSPVYFGNMSSLCKAFLDRWMYFRQEGFVLSNKVAGVVAVGGSRNGGQETTISAVQSILMTQELVIVGDGRPRAHGGGTVWSGIEGGVEADEYGLASAKNLGRRIAEVGLMMHG